jgi:hypothetical protein
VDGGRLPRNVAAAIKLPKVQRREMRFLTAAQVEALADAIAPPYGVLIRFAAYAGLRAVGVRGATRGAASRPLKRARCGCHGRSLTSWASTWPTARMARGLGVHRAAWWAAPDPLPLAEVRLVEALVGAHGSPEVRGLMRKWRARAGESDVDHTIGLEEQSARPVAQLREWAMRELKAIPECRDAMFDAAEAIRQRVRHELAGEV